MYYPAWFKNDGVWALIHSGNEFNAITPTYAAKLGLKIHRTDGRAQKIHGSIFKTSGMVLVSFQVEDQLERACFFQKTFLLDDINMERVLRMLFLIFSNTNI